MQTIKIKAEKRENVGRKSTAALRRDGAIPGVIYGGNEVIHFSTDLNELRPIVYTNKFYKVEIEVDGKAYPTVLKDIQFHPVSEDILHIDFQELIPGKKVKTALPIVLEGQAVGTREGGKLFPKMRYLRVKALAENMMDSVVVDVSDLELGKSIKVGEIPDLGIQVLDAPSLPICSIEIPRALKSAQAAEGEEGEEGVEGEEGAEGAEGGSGEEGGAPAEDGGGTEE